MSNKYGIKLIEGSPSQKDIDGFLNWCDDNPPDITGDVLKFNKKMKDKLKKKLDDLEKEINLLFKDTTEPPTKKIRAAMAPIEPLIEPPSSLDDCLSFCKNVANYFKGPYLKLVELITWWSAYTAACSSAILGAISRTLKMKAKIEADPFGEKN